MPKRATQANDEFAALTRELKGIKWLFAAYLIRQGVKRSDIAAVLEVDAAVVSRAIPKGVRAEKEPK